MDHLDVIDENTSESFHQNLMEEEITLPESPESLPASNLQLIKKTGSSGTDSFKVKEEENPSRLGHSFFSSLLPAAQWLGLVEVFVVLVLGKTIF